MGTSAYHPGVPHRIASLVSYILALNGLQTFCGAVTRPPDELAQYHASLTNCTAWDAPTIAAWARALTTQHVWAERAAEVLEANGVTGRELCGLIEQQVSQEAKKQASN